MPLNALVYTWHGHPWPPIRVGRPRKAENMSAHESERFKSFLEKLHAQGEKQAHILEAAAGVALTKNPGGKHTKKRCSICRSENHRCTQCPELKEAHLRVKEAHLRDPASSVSDKRDDHEPPIGASTEAEVEVKVGPRPKTHKRKEPQEAQELSKREQEPEPHNTGKVVSPYGPYVSRASALEELKHLMGQHLKVVGDGRCWRYAMLASLGMLQHATTMEEDHVKQVTAQDIKVADEFLEQMKRGMADFRGMSEREKKYILGFTSTTWGGETALRCA